MNRKEELKKEITNKINSIERVGDKYNYIELLEAEIKGIEETEKEFADWLDKMNTEHWETFGCKEVQDKIKELRGEK